MDAAYNAHQARRKTSSSFNPNHPTLAPLTMKLSINDTHTIFSEKSVNTFYSTSYIQGKSAPSTPSLLARSPRSSSRHEAREAMTPRSRGPASPILPKSKSTTHISSRFKSGAPTPGGYRRATKNGELQDEETQVTAGNNNNDNINDAWAVRTGVLLSSDAREQKGQSWLISRASSTRLDCRGQTGEDDENAPADMFEHDRIARENVIASRHASRRGSFAFAPDEESPFASRLGSEHASRAASRTHFVLPGGTNDDADYFGRQVMIEGELVPGPDFVNLDLKLEAIGAETGISQDDEAAVRRLVKQGHGRPGTWLGNILGFRLYVEDYEEEENEVSCSTDDEDEDSLSETSDDKTVGRVTAVIEQRPSPPKDDVGGWQDAAWFLTIASRVAWPWGKL